MHEMALAESILQIVESQAQQTKVLSVTLKIGQLAAVELEALRFCFDVVTQNSCAHGATLQIETESGTAFCFDCLAQVPLKQRGDPCPQCQGYRLTVVSGDQMNVKYLEIE